MPTTTDVRVNDLIINKMTQEQYDALQEKSPTELYVVEGDSNVIYAEQATVLPAASADNLGKLYQYIGATDANYTQNYFYKCTSAGDPAVYSWTQIDVQPAPDPLPSQSGQSGKFLTTDGTNASWSNKPLVNTGTNAGLAIQTANYEYVGDNQESLVIGPYSRIYYGKYCTLLGGTATIHDLNNNTVRAAVVIGDSATSSRSYTTALGTSAITDAIGAIQIGKGTNTEAGTVRFGLTTNGSTWQNYKLLGSDGTIPADRLVNSIAKYSTIPTAASTNEGWIVQYTGATDSTYTHGYIYECISDGAAEPTYSWVQVDVQPAADPLPSQTGKTGKFLMTDGTTASWEEETTVEFRVWGAND